MHFISDDADPVAIVGGLRDRLAAGSHVVISHVTWEGQPPEAIEAQHLSERTPTTIIPRSKAEIEAMFDGLIMVEPGLVHFPSVATRRSRRHRRAPGALRRVLRDRSQTVAAMVDGALRD
jgi:hypothetical protein